MTESQYTRALVSDLRRLLDRTVVFKHADRFTAGVPDLSVTYHGNTTWIEVKRLPKLRAAAGFVNLIPACVVPSLQWETLRRLETGYMLVSTCGGAIVFHVAGQPATKLSCRELNRLELLKLLAGIFQRKENDDG